MSTFKFYLMDRSDNSMADVITVKHRSEVSDEFGDRFRYFIEKDVYGDFFRVLDQGEFEQARQQGNVVMLDSKECLHPKREFRFEKGEGNTYDVFYMCMSCSQTGKLRAATSEEVREKQLVDGTVVDFEFE